MPQHEVGGSVIAFRNGEAKEFAERNIHIRVWIFVLKRAVRYGMEQIAWKKPNGLIECEFSLFDEMQSVKRDWQLEDRLHRWMGMRLEIAIQRRAGKRACDGNLAMCIGCDFANFVVQRSLCGERKRK